jgi:transcription elongation factor Elf1
MSGQVGVNCPICNRYLYVAEAELIQGNNRVLLLCVECATSVMVWEELIRDKVFF